jgi:ubiquinone/menaquinone biosynthesis C-methylase UbiE
MQTNLWERGITNPKTILDVGCGVGPNSFHYAQMYPEAEVIGIDLAPSMLRTAKLDAERRGITNVSFYQMDGGDLSYFADETFDIVHQGACVHEMPADHGRTTFREMLRVLKTGGILTVFDRGIAKTEGDWKVREWMVSSTQEPFLLEYDRFNWPEWIQTLDVALEENPRLPKGWKWDGSSTSWLGVKGPETNRLLKETAFSEADRERIRYAEDAPLKWNHNPHGTKNKVETPVYR